MARSPERLYPGFTPLYCRESSGAYFVDLDGNRWIDIEMAMGSAVWGHGREEIQQAICEQMKKGFSHSLGSEVELTLARKLLARVEKYDFVKFSKNGADVVTEAVRIARSATGRMGIMCGAYHGWHDWSAVSYYRDCSLQNLGIPDSIRKDTHTFGDTVLTTVKEVLLQHRDELACAVVCPGDWTVENLAELKELCQEFSILLIFDEVTSFVRAGKMGIAGRCKIWPDLLCISKGLANGLPLAALLGPAHLMETVTSIRFSHANASEPLALAAADAGEQLLSQHEEWPSWKRSAAHLISVIRQHIDTVGLTDRLTISGDYAGFRLHTPGHSIHTDPFREHLVKQLAKMGIFPTGYVLLSDKHGLGECQQVEVALLSCVEEWTKITKSRALE